MRAAAVIGTVLLVPCMVYPALTASPDLGATLDTMQAVEVKPADHWMQPDLPPRGDRSYR